MSHQAIQAIVLAAGRSSRFNAKTTKLAVPLCGQEMIVYQLKILRELQLPITLVVGHQQEVIRKIVEKYFLTLNFVEQEKQLGTGSAVAVTQPVWCAENILVMNGDMPLVTGEIIAELMREHEKTQATVTFAVAHHSDPGSYGRVVIQEGIIRIVEAPDVQNHRELSGPINAGIYIFKKSFLETYCSQLLPYNVKKELYLTDLIKIACEQGYIVSPVFVPFDQIRGVNTLKELWTAEHIKRSELISHWMERGVYFSSPHTTHLDWDISIGESTRIDAGVRVVAGSRIGEGCAIEAFSYIENSVLENNVHVKQHSIIQDSMIAQSAQIGPFAHIRSESSIGTESVIGNFVEVSKSSIGNRTKVKHLSYLGNAVIGSSVNIGAGTVICNYNGMTKTKSTTVIEDGAMIGANNSIVAPVTLAREAMTAAGSTITENVPQHALAIARARQVNKEGYCSLSPFVAAIKTDDSTMHEES